LLATQQPDGSWSEPAFTGTGFPRVFYLRYHLYRLYFPLMALARYKTAVECMDLDERSAIGSMSAQTMAALASRIPAEPRALDV
jgi:squalene-hopene/tetraprenyl-beta-curcumene cyclase